MIKHPPHLEAEWLAQIANRDHRAFKTVYDHYRPLIYSFALKYLKSSEPAEEVVQEVFLKFWRMEHSLLDIGNLNNFLLTMTRNRALDVLRRMKLERTYAFPLEAASEELSHDTEEAILLRDTKKVLDDAVALLPPQQQLVYTLCRIEGLKHEEAAKRLELSPETVKRHMKLALKFLRSYAGSRTDITVILIILKLL